MSFSLLGLSGTALQAIQSAGYTTPTEIQRQAIPPALDGKDILGCAPTGTGKTAAFVLPIIAQLSKRQGAPMRTPRALVLTPTRELAQQVQKSVQIYGAQSHLRSVAIYGGAGMSEQLAALRRGVDVVVATPGRLADHMQRRSIDLRTIEVLVLDEADRMYDMGFIQEVRRIVGQTPRDRQTLLFSATMSYEIRSLVAEIQRTPVRIDIEGSCSAVKTVAQRFFGVAQPAKTELLLHILQSEPIQTMLVFSRTKHGADRISKRLAARGIAAEAIHSDRSQNQRDRALDGFRRKRFRVLVATDVAARGIDVTGISHVVNYDTPPFAEDYVHRIGRTGRAEATGIAFTFVSSEERKYLRKIEQVTSSRCSVELYPGFSQGEMPAPEAPARRAAAPFGRRAAHFYGNHRLPKWKSKRGA